MFDEQQYVGMMIDPPSGWRYGFPRAFNPRPGETMSDWFLRMGYPKQDLELAMKYSRMWPSQ